VSYCPKCGRRIYKEEKGCEFCGIVNDRSLWQGVGGIKSQDHTLDHDFTEKSMIEEKPNVWNKEMTKTKSAQKEYEPKSIYGTETQGDKVFPGIVKVILVMMMFVMTLAMPLGGFLIGIVLGFLLKNSPFESYRAFGKVLINIALVLLVFWFGIAVFGFTMFMKII